MPYGLASGLPPSGAKKFFTKVGVGRRFLPPPNTGQMRVRKSYICAARNPVLSIRADGQPPETADMARRAKGRYLAGKVRMKIVTLELGLSWLKV